MADDCMIIPEADELIAPILSVIPMQLLAYYIGGSRLYLIGYAAVFLIIMLLLPRGILSTLVHRRRMVALAEKQGADGNGVVSVQSTETSPTDELETDANVAPASAFGGAAR